MFKFLQTSQVQMLDDHTEIPHSGTLVAIIIRFWTKFPKMSFISGYGRL